LFITILIDQTFKGLKSHFNLSPLGENILLVTSNSDPSPNLTSYFFNN